MRNGGKGCVWEEPCPGKNSSAELQTAPYIPGLRTTPPSVQRPSYRIRSCCQLSYSGRNDRRITVMRWQSHVWPPAGTTSYLSIRERTDYMYTEAPTHVYTFRLPHTRKKAALIHTKGKPSYKFNHYRTFSRISHTPSLGRSYKPHCVLDYGNFSTVT